MIFTSNHSKGAHIKQFQWAVKFIVMSLFAPLAAATVPKESYVITPLASGLNSPWSMVQLPSGLWLITERDGHIVVVDNSKQTRVRIELEGLYFAGQGGLLDIALTPDYTQSNEIILTYAQGELNANRLVVAKIRFDGKGFSKPDIIFTLATDKNTPQHYAGRVLTLPDNTLLVTSGDGFDYREQAQVVTNQLGKILRINLDGSIPKSNPFTDNTSALAHPVFTLGHRNTQGLIYDYDEERIISHEHGPAGGDELNLINAGNNYGWPVITYGKDYSQARISPFTEYPGMVQPLVDWTPSIAPSGMAYYGSAHESFPELRNHILITTLVDKKLYAINVSNNHFRQSHVITELKGRLRDVYVTQQGDIAVLTDGKKAQLLLVSGKK